MQLGTQPGTFYEGQMAGLGMLSVLWGRQLRVLGQDSAPGLGESGISRGPHRRDRQAQSWDGFRHSLVASPAPEVIDSERQDKTRIEKRPELE